MDFISASPGTADAKAAALLVEGLEDKQTVVNVHLNF